MKILKLILTIIIFILLTVLTQIGGLIYLTSFLTHKLINKRYDSRLIRTVLKFTAFLIFYSFATFIVVPLVAKPFGRVPLPLSETEKLRPLNFLTCFLNRHYVKPELKQTAMEVSKEMNEKFPGTITNYLDANFPFINRFPLIPHFSHNDGKKLDISFCYIDTNTGKQTNECPSSIGYGICEEPRPNEINTANICADKAIGNTAC